MLSSLWFLLLWFFPIQSVRVALKAYMNSKLGFEVAVFIDFDRTLRKAIYVYSITADIGDYSYEKVLVPMPLINDIFDDLDLSNKRNSGNRSRNGKKLTRAPSGEWRHDKFDSKQAQPGKKPNNSKSSALSVNSLAARIDKAPTSKALKSSLATSNKEAIAKQLANNPLFAAIQGPRTNKTREPIKNDTKSKRASMKVTNTNKKPAKLVSQKTSNRVFEIKGIDGQTYVRIMNLAQGTTDKDVTAFLQRMGFSIHKCRTYGVNSTVAEVLFPDKRSAESCIAQVDNAMADGKIIHAVIIDATDAMK
ncbi:hypothetical protein V1511DRAFT_531374 [Dipodascopsis uninucleata]